MLKLIANYDDELVLKLNGGAGVQLYKFTEKHQTIYLMWVNFMVYK